ncbi:hypothetical protein O4H49_10390 [Kiloniella laminariae]|uniref:Uncharacterized protein n=1 Tax=Kiloniella laminariae TaxID=454162 RepID=A0ABT4LMJ6_9PROT|nr:hypothetical protein [Kiloniella laminariae]MCZ4281187.1 hypothetical protein [Kiloniella laminariae]
MVLDAAWAAIIGAAVGSLITVAGSAGIDWVSGHRARLLAKKRKTRLLRMLSDGKFKWRSLSQLSASVGASESATMELLIEIDARASLQNPLMWALLSRAPWSNDVQPTE